MKPYTYITIEETGIILGKPYGTVKAASARDVFTRVPVTSHQQSLVKEQVELFKGKKQLKLSALNKEELQKWHEIDTTIANMVEREVPQGTPFQLVTSLKDLIRKVQNYSENTRVHSHYS